MNRDRIDTLIARYRDGLLQDTLPFWIAHGIDREHGGFLTGLDRDGVVVDTDKAIWAQGRFTWLLATLHRTVEPRDEWLALAEHGIRFLEAHGFDSDGRMFFLVTRDGRPLRRRRYAYSEAFASLAFAAYAAITGSDRHAARARTLFETFREVAFTPGVASPKVDPGTRPAKSIGPLMITLHAAQILRDTIGFDGASDVIDRTIGEIDRDFVKPEHEAVMETVGADGQILEDFDGRTLNPGHAIEAAWFILHEASERGGDAALVGLGTRMLDWMWVRGWDETSGGLRYFTGVDDRPVQEYWQEMKFWWPHNEATIATLLAHVVTGDPQYETWHRMVDDWAHEHFADPEHGEWFGYLDRAGRPTTTLKGGHWKGPYHLPRMQWYCWRLLASLPATGHET